MKSSLLATTVLASALVWTVVLVVDSGPFQAAPTLLVGLGMLATATVATVGMIVARGRWAHRLALASLAMTVVVAVVREIDVAWVAGITITALALVALLSPGLTRNIRQLPSASGPPPRAVAPALLLLVAPALIGFVGNDATPWALLVVGLTAPIVAFLYSRVFPGGLVAIRLVWPLMTLALAPWLGWMAGVVAAALASAVGVVAWDRSVKASYHPPREVGSTYRIPPELTPEEVRDAAGIDDKGRRK